MRPNDNPFLNDPEWMRKRYAEATIQEIADELGCGYWVVRDRLQRFGVPLRRPSQRANPVPIETRFWSRVDIGDDSECWNWTGPIFPTGYGSFKWGTMGRAHRVAYTLAHGSDPGPLLVCHRCDNRLCCNPAHLFLGTYADNNRDGREKGRILGPPPSIGTRNVNAKLTPALVTEIRQRRAQGELLKEIAEDYGVSARTILSVCARITWKHV